MDARFKNQNPKNIEGSFLTTPGFHFVVALPIQPPPHEINIDLNLKFRTGIINNAFVLLLGKDYSQSKAYSPN